MSKTRSVDPVTHAKRTGAPRPIEGIMTSTAAFVGAFARGPIRRPLWMIGITDFEEIFGGLDARSEASYGVHQFFLNGGQKAWVVRAGRAATASAGQLLAAIETLDRIEPRRFDLLCLPETANLSPEEAAGVHARALAYATGKGAFYFPDPPSSVATVDAMLDWVAGFQNAAASHAEASHAAVYFPRLTMPDPLNDDQPRDVASSGTVAGIYARTELTRGVWNAPAGSKASIRGAEPATTLSELDSGRLSARGVNVLRVPAVGGPVVWGARTLAVASNIQWRYVSVRRLAIYIEQSLRQGLQWTVFEPNDEPLWKSIRNSVGVFLSMHYINSVFVNSSSSDAYFVKCDRTTTTEADIKNGVVNVVAGFAPLIPTEFVILKIQLRAGQTAGGG